MNIKVILFALTMVVLNIFVPMVKTQSIIFICSSFCALSGCNGWTPDECNGQCATGWSYTGSNCQVSGAGRQYIDCSQDIGGTITVTSTSSRANPCTNFPSGVSITPYGQYRPSENITIELASGTLIPHYQIDLLLTIILIDQDQGGSKRWDNNANLSASLINITSSAAQQTKSGFRLDGSKMKTLGKTYCKDNGKKDEFTHFKETFTHNETTSIKFQISTINPGVDAAFAIKQVIMVAIKCHIGCLTCNSSSNINKCFSCNPDQGYMLNNNSCLTNCTTDFGYTDDPAVCIYCNLYCKTCYGVFDNCSSCQSASPWGSYLIENTTLGYSVCVTDCGLGFFKNNTLRTCDYCDFECLECVTTASRCTACKPGQGWFNHTCYVTCPSGMFLSGSNCTFCNNTCISCVNETFCYDCVINGTNKAFLLGNLCVKTCPDGYYHETNFDLGPNLCLQCMLPCTKCTGAPKPCQSCDNTTFLYIDECVTSCPTGIGYVANIVTRQCIDCQVNCVDLSINMYFVDQLSHELYIDMTFTKPMDFAVFDYINFQTVSIGGLDSSQYNLTISLINNFSYRIIIEPIGYIFLYNETASVTTKIQPTIPQTSNDTTPLKPSTYMKTATINWFLLKSPQMTQIEKSIINNFAGINNVIASVTTQPGLSEIKKSGVLTLLFSGAQLTTCSVFLKSIPAQNMYEAMRFWGLFVLYDVPSWQQNSKIKNKVFQPDVYDMTKDARLLFNMDTVYWRFTRTGQSSFFIFDVYIPLLLIMICWITALVGYLLNKFCKYNFKRFEASYFSIFHKIHQMSIMYLTIAMMMQFIYFDGNSGTRWLSLFICLLCSAYFVSYQLYIYYEMIKYPEAVIGSQKFEYYVTRYGGFLKNIRYQQYDVNEQWSIKHWFRPYNYHFLSYYKKFCMLIAFPIFYQVPYFQVSVVLIIQTLQIIRFVKTNPYNQRWRTVYRFLLEFFLFTFFLISLILEFQINKITDNSNPNLDRDIRLFYNLGWIGFGSVFVFNIGFLVLFFIDFSRSFKYSARQMIEESRRIYYYDKVKQYQTQNQQVPLGLMNKWVKLGNLNKRKYEDLPDINFRVEYFRLIKHNQYYDVQILKIVDLFMNIDLNFHQQNNTKVGKKIRKRIRLSKDNSKKLFMIIQDIFAKYSKKDTEAINLKTYALIKQNKFFAGDKIPLLPEEMFQKIQLQDRFGNKKSIKLPEKLKGFPVNAYDIQSL